MTPATPSPAHNVPARGQMIGWLELFYDLVFVAAILVLSSAVSHLHDATKITLVVAVFVSLWWIWLATTLFVDRHRVDDVPQQLLVLGQMFLVTVVAMEGHAGVVRDAQALSVAYGLLVGSVAVMYWRVVRVEPSSEARRHALLGALAAAMFVVAAFVPDPGRYVIWVVGAVVTVLATLGPATERRSETAIDEHHLLERFGAFTIIVCGEAFVKVAIAVSDAHVDEIDIIALAFQFVLTFVIWTSYFEDVPHAGIAARRRSSWVGLHLVLQLAIAGTAIGVSQLVKTDPLEHVPAEDILEITATLATVFLALAFLGLCTRRSPARPLFLLRIGTTVAVVATGVGCWLVPWIDVAEGVAALSVVAVVYSAVAYRFLGRTSVEATSVDRPFGLSSRRSPFRRP
ncbi:MAG TPA: low temperature requirement protein A [Acidimicrobiia bacterium]|nr:low temperature requirement protein A [Acidimicrobiia bacterium]